MATTPLKLTWAIAGCLVLVFFFQGLLASRLKSPTYDEPSHIAAGLSYLQSRTIVANPQHPPLIKELSGLALLAAGIRLPDTTLVRNMESGIPDADNDAGSELIHNGGAARVLFWARLPTLLLSALTGLLLFAWGRQLLGDAAALGALFLYALSPTLIANSYLVTTDMGLAGLTLLFLFALWNYLRFPSWQRMAWCGAAMGAMLAAKFSAVAMVPVGAALLLASFRWPVPRAAGSPAAFWDGRRAALAPPASGKNAPCPCGSGKKYKACHGAKPASPDEGHPSLFRLALVFGAMCLVALFVVEACYFFPSDWLTYVAGAQRVNADHDPNFWYYLGGRLEHHFLIYFVVAWFFKEPLAAVLLTAIGAGLLASSKRVSTIAKLFLAVPPLVLLVGYSVLADDLGVRYLIPILPFTYLAAGWGLQSLWQRRAWWTRGAAVALCGWLIVEAAAIYPDHLSYFNELTCLPSNVRDVGLDGGSRCGPLWLDDHNVDWGQGLPQLKAWLDAHEAGRTLKLGYFGSYPPENYGLVGAKVRLNGVLVRMRLTSRFNDTVDFHAQPEPGLYAVSAHLVARLPALGARFAKDGGVWLRTVRPTAIVGHAYYVYDIPEKP